MDNKETLEDAKNRADINASTLVQVSEVCKYMLAISGGAIALAITNYDKFPFKLAVLLAAVAFIYSLYYTAKVLQSLWFHQLQALAKDNNLVATSNYITKTMFNSLKAFVIGCVLTVIALVPIPAILYSLLLVVCVY